jgi:hypothetical protein
VRRPAWSERQGAGQGERQAEDAEEGCQGGHQQGQAEAQTRTEPHAKCRLVEVFFHVGQWMEREDQRDYQKITELRPSAEKAQEERGEEKE